MGRGMCTKHRLLVDVVGIRFVPARMVGPESEVVKILLGRNNWGQRVEIGEASKMGFNERSECADRMVLL